MDSALLQNLMAGAGSSSQFIGGLVVALLYAVIGLLSAIGSILIFRRLFQGRWEQIFWTSFLVVIAAFYLSFAAYFGASTHAWQTEVVGVAVFLVCAVGGLFFRSAIAVGYSRTRAPQRKKYWERILTLSLEIHLLFDVLHRSFYPLQTTEDAE